MDAPLSDDIAAISKRSFSFLRDFENRIVGSGDNIGPMIEAKYTPGLFFHTLNGIDLPQAPPRMKPYIGWTVDSPAPTLGDIPAGIAL